MKTLPVYLIYEIKLKGFNFYSVFTVDFICLFILFTFLSLRIKKIHRTKDNFVFQKKNKVKRGTSSFK
jgi:hypothetical protein